MITLAVAAAFQTLASQLSDFTGGEDGLTFKMPELLSPGFQLSETPFLGVTLDGRLICYYLLFVAARGAAAGDAAHRQLAVRPRAAGDPRERVPRRGDRLPRGGLPHHVEHPVGAVRHAGRRDAGDLAALQRPGHLAVLRDHAGRAADRGDRRHGHHLRRGHRLGRLRGGAKLPAGPAQARQRCHVGPALAVGAAVAGPLAAVAGPAVRAVRLLLPDRHRRAPARRAKPDPVPFPQPPGDISENSRTSIRTLSRREPIVGAACRARRLARHPADARRLRRRRRLGPARAQDAPGRSARGADAAAGTFSWKGIPYAKPPVGRAALAGAAGAAGLDHRPRHHVLRQRLRAIRPHLRPGRQQQVRRDHRHHARTRPWAARIACT